MIRLDVVPAVDQPTDREKGESGMIDPTPSPGLMADLEQASWRSLTGDAAAVADHLARELRSRSDTPVDVRLPTEFYLAVAQSRARQWLGATRTATTVLRLADQMNAPGWAANALAIRALAQHARGASVETVGDLVRAEYELGRCTDAHLLANGHQWLGLVYEQMSLFELAAPHYQWSHEMGSGLPTNARSMVADELSIAGLYGALATELQMLGPHDSRTRRELGKARQEAYAHADAACGRAGPSIGVRRTLHARLVRCQNGPDEQAGARAPELERVRLALVDAHDDTSAVAATASLAEALLAAGDARRAQDEARRALDGLAPEQSDLGARFVTWMFLWVSSQQGDLAAAVGLRAVGATARTWWSHRLGRLAAMRAAIDGYVIAVDGEKHRVDARRDALTGLGNRRMFDEQLASAGEHVVVSIVDLNDLKVVNDTWGHEAGDALLVMVAQVLTDSIRHTDHAARIGGDEFAVILTDASEVDGTTLMERIHDGVKLLARAATDPATARLSVSTGAAATSEGLEISALMAVADQRMYAAKRDGRGPRVDSEGLDPID